MDVLAVVSNCPQMNNPVNDYNPTPVRAKPFQPGLPTPSPGSTPV
jgi:uncharacterized protein YcgI (DUF1989 family)